MTRDHDSSSNDPLTRRTFLAGVGVAGAAAILPLQAAAEPSSAEKVAAFVSTPLSSSEDDVTKHHDEVTAAKIRRALLSGPASVTNDATVMEMNPDGRMTVLRQGTNKWICLPGNENKIGAPPMCADPAAMQWFADAQAHKPRPTNSIPGICYMLCGATQHSNTDPFDTTSPAIPIGPHWMILWPFDAKAAGLPTTVRDKGAWVMFAGTPYAYLHICGTPWDGNEYQDDGSAVWTMKYARP